MLLADENELYEKWRNTPEVERTGVEEQLYSSVKRHAQAVVSENFPEGYRELPHDIATAVIFQLPEFRGESRFSTWVHSIAILKGNEELRTRIRRREVFDDTTEVVTDPHEEENRRNVVPTITPDLEGPIAFEELSENLSDEDSKLLGYKREGLSSKEAADKMGTTVEAIDSRWARLKPRLKEIRS